MPKANYKCSGRGRSDKSKRCYRRTGFNKRLELYSEKFQKQNERCECGGKWIFDGYRSSGEEHRRVQCNCGGYHFPHRKGSRFCEHNLNEKSDEDYEDYKDQLMRMARKEMA